MKSSAPKHLTFFLFSRPLTTIHTHLPQDHRASYTVCKKHSTEEEESHMHVWAQSLPGRVKFQLAEREGQLPETVSGMTEPRNRRKYRKEGAHGSHQQGD